jgi:hypothetical protein
MNDEVLTRYLLGEASEEEQLRLEEEFFKDDEAYQQLLALEDELKYEYAQGGLTRQQRKSFEKRFLRTPEDRDKVALAEAVLAKAYEVKRQRQPSWLQSFAGLFAVRSPMMQFGFAAAAMLLVVGGSWSVFQMVRLQNRVGELEAERKIERQQTDAQRGQQEQLRNELASAQNRNTQLEQELAKRQPSTSNFLSFVLVPGLTRDAEGPKRLVVPADTSEARFQFDVKGKGPYKSYRAELQTVEGDQIWSQDVPRPSVAIPARLLRAGDYEVVLKGITAEGETQTAGEYYFVVVRR